MRSEGLFVVTLSWTVLYIRVISHGSEGCTGYSDPLGRLYISVISHGSEGMDMWRTVQIFEGREGGVFC